MQLSKYTDYSFRVLIHLAHNQDRLCTIDEIAQRFSISNNHLKKVVHQLSKEGYITSIKGRNGGIKLGMKPEDINLGDVLLKVEDNFHLAECFACKESCILSSNCKLTRIMNTALHSFLKEFKHTHLSDIM